MYHNKNHIIKVSHCTSDYSTLSVETLELERFDAKVKNLIARMLLSQEQPETRSMSQTTVAKTKLETELES